MVKNTNHTDGEKQKKRQPESSPLYSSNRPGRYLPDENPSRPCRALPMKRGTALTEPHPAKRQPLPIGKAKSEDYIIVL
jgi:hypothetical protein